jgi:hypothetical protein
MVRGIRRGDMLAAIIAEGHGVQARNSHRYFRAVPAKAAVTPRPMNTPPVT